MEYREIKGIPVSLLGFGCMRFPRNKDDGSINEERAEALLDRAYASGVTYFDTAYNYHEGKSEEFVGRVMQKHPRDSFCFATKLPVWKIDSLDDAKHIFEEQLNNLRSDYVDFYLFHALNRERFEKLKTLGIIPYFEEMQKQGKIRKLGFSFHDTYDAFEEIIKYRTWDFCQLQLNYMDMDQQAGANGVALAKSLGTPIVVMEPVKGGQLTAFPDDISRMMKAAEPHKSIASWGMRYAASLDGVSVVLSGMTLKGHLSDNIKTLGKFVPFNDDDLSLIKRITNALRKRVRNGCTGCRYCMPCPSGVTIPACFDIWNEYAMYGNKKRAVYRYSKELPDAEKPFNCINCGKCMTMCPQGSFDIPNDLKRMAAEIGVLK